MINLQKNKFLYLFLAIFGFLILFLRNSNPFIFQTLYAEDGTWAGKIISEGWLYTAFNARPEFPVLGLVILNKIALILSVIFGSILYLPLSIAIVANSFYVMMAMSVFWIGNSLLKIESKLIVFLCILLIPVGSDANEIFGRILNLGFIFPVLQLILTLVIFTSHTGNYFRFFYLTTQLIASLTFPVCFIFNVITFLLLIFLNRENRTLTTIIKPMCFVILIPLLVFLFKSDLFTKGGADLPINYNALVEFSLARSYLYPFVSCIYKYLNNTLTIFTAIIFSIFIFYFVVKRDRISRYIFCYTAISFASYLIVTIVFRSGLSSFFSDYQGTFPDRYFYGINIIFIILYSIAVDSIDWLKCSNRVKNLILFFPLICMFLAINQIFEFDHPKIKFNQIGTFKETFCKVYDNQNVFFEQSNSQQMEIPIYPLVDNYLWRFSIPNEFFFENSIERCNL